MLQTWPCSLFSRLCYVSQSPQSCRFSQSTPDVLNMSTLSIPLLVSCLTIGSLYDLYGYFHQRCRRLPCINGGSARNSVIEDISQIIILSKPSENFVISSLISRCARGEPCTRRQIGIRPILCRTDTSPNTIATWFPAASVQRYFECRNTPERWS